MRRFDRLESEFKEVTSNENEGFLALRIPRRRFNFRILAESVRGIEISKVVEENICYKRAICESMMIANGEGFMEDLQAKVGQQAQGGVLKQFSTKLLRAFISTLQLFWKHIKEFILAFFDIGVKATRVGVTLNKILSRVEKKDSKFKGFIRTDFNKEVKELPNIDPYDYIKVIHTLTDVSGRILSSFDNLHKLIEKSFVDKIKDKFKSKSEIKVYEFQNANTKLNEDKKKLKELTDKITLAKNNDDNVNMNGKYLWEHVNKLNEAFQDMTVTPKGQSSNLLSNFKKIKNLSSKKHLDELIADIQNKFKASEHEFSEHQSILHQISNIVRASNRTLVEVHGVGKIYLGNMIKNAGILLKILKENVTIAKPKLDADVNVKVDLSDAFGIKKSIKNIKERVKR